MRFSVSGHTLVILFALHKRATRGHTVDIPAERPRNWEFAESPTLKAPASPAKAKASFMRVRMQGAHRRAKLIGAAAAAAAALIIGIASPKPKKSLPCTGFTRPRAGAHTHQFPALSLPVCLPARIHAQTSLRLEARRSNAGAWPGACKHESNIVTPRHRHANLM